MTARAILVTCVILSLLMTTVAELDAAGPPSTLQGPLKAILTQIEAQPDFRIAGELVLMQDDLIRFYEQRSYEPLWTTSDDVGRSQVRALLRRLDASHSIGLCEADYHLPFFRDLLSRFSVEENYSVLPRLSWAAWYDILMTDALFYYALHLIEGRVPADSIQEGWEMRKPKVDLMDMINLTFEHGELDKFLSDFQPTHKGYLALQQALERYREIEAFGGWASIPAGESLRVGMIDKRVSLLRTRLLLSDDLIGLPRNNSDRMEMVDVEALKRFQRRHGLIPDGILGERTLTALNVSVSDRVRQIELNMERWRWLPKTLGQKYLLVNIADFSVSIVDQGKTVLSMPVVVGNSYRKTPVFSARLEYIEFAPYWYVPPTILEEDKLPLIKQDVEYVERNHYEIVGWDRRSIIEPQSIDWEEVDIDNFPGLLRQKPGPWNALGRIKFILPNSHAIYLHDTNERNNFWQRNRQLSSGCVRLEKPAKLAEYLLEGQGWDNERVDEAMASEKPQRIYLKKPLPVHVLYWTAWSDDLGQIHFREDAYGRDQDLLRAIIRSPSRCSVHRLNVAMQ